MNIPATAHSRWSTSAFGDATGASAAEVYALGEHLNLCKGLQGRLFAWRCMADRLNGFVAARFVTTLVVATLFIGLSVGVTVLMA